MQSLEGSPSAQRQIQKASGKCPRCGKAALVLDAVSGELICSNCGFVVKDRIEETGPEWRSFSDDQKADRSRTGLPTSVAQYDMGLSTVIGPSGKTVSGNMRTTVERMRTWDRRSQAHSTDRNMRRAFSELRTFAEKLSLSEEAVERAAYIYRKAMERGLVRGRSITTIIAASLYASVRDLSIPRSLKEVASVSALKRKDLARDYRLLVRELDLKMPIADPARSVPKIASKAGVSEKARRTAFEILARAKEAGISSGKDPMGLAAAAIYIASVLEGEKKRQKDIAKAAEVTEVTIRNRYKGLKVALGI
ncbi:MAG: transcription initiation factor IIB [Thaumarchaeota archaeon]|nr:transcription initiation factor IIB [Nitrososphaerota archaeon]